MNGRLPTDPLLFERTVPRTARWWISSVPPGTLARNTGAVWLDTPNRILPSPAAGLDRVRASDRAADMSLAADDMHITNTQIGLCATTWNPAIKLTTGRRAGHTCRLHGDRQPARDRAVRQATSTPVENIGEIYGMTALTVQLEKRFGDFLGRGACPTVYGHGRGNTSGHSGRGQRLPGPRQSTIWTSTKGRPTPTGLHALTLSGRLEVPWIKGPHPGGAGRALSRAARPFTIHDSNVDANRQQRPVSTRCRQGPTAALGRTRSPSTTKGGRNGAYGPDLVPDGRAAGYRLRPMPVIASITSTPRSSM